MSEDKAIKELSSTFLGLENVFIEVREERFFLKDSRFVLENYSLKFLGEFLRSFCNKCVVFEEFYKMGSQWKSQSLEKKFLEQNLFQSLFKTVEGYINFKVIKYQRVHKLTEFSREIQVFFEEISKFNGLVQNFLKRRNMNLIDYFYETLVLSERNYFEKFLMRDIFKLSAISAIRMIEDITFKNTSLGVLNKNLDIDF